jgi:signal peptidase I
MSAARGAYPRGCVLIGSDRFAAPRSRAGRAGRARCLAVLLAGACVLAIALAGCGGGGHTSSTAAADANGAVVGGAGTTGTSTTGGSTSAGQSGTSTSATSTSTASTGSASGQGNGAGAAGSPGTGGVVRNGPNIPAASHGGSSGKPAAKHKSKAASKTPAGSGAGTAGTGSGSGTGSGGSPGPNAPSANSGIPYEVHTTSMEPTYQPETTIYYDPTRTHPQIGEVVVFYLPSGAEEGACGEVMAGGRACTSPLPGMTKNKEISLKRVVGLPGDSIAVRQGHVIRNGQPEQPEPQIVPCDPDERLNCEFPTPITVPQGSYYLMADNRGLDKEDSRIFGAVPQEYILGTVEGS